MPLLDIPLLQLHSPPQPSKIHMLSSPNALDEPAYPRLSLYGREDEGEAMGESKVITGQACSSPNSI